MASARCHSGSSRRLNAVCMAVFIIEAAAARKLLLSSSGVRLSLSTSLLTHCPATMSDALVTLPPWMRTLNRWVSTMASSPLVEHMVVWCTAMAWKKGKRASWCRNAVSEADTRVSMASAFLSTLLAPEKSMGRFTFSVCRTRLIPDVRMEKNSAL